MWFYVLQSLLLLFTIVVGDGGPPDPPPKIYNSLTIINATPYPWKNVGSNAFQVDGWVWPDTIPSGQSHTVQWNVKKDLNDAADIDWRLVIDGQLSGKGTVVHVSRPDYGQTKLSAKLYGGLSSVGNPSNAFFDIALHYVPAGTFIGGGSSFVLTGDELNGYFSSNPPAGWMSAMGDTLKGLTLRQVSLPASHDAGMSEITSDGQFRGGVSDNSQTQSNNLYQQLLYGTRVFDIRPYTAGVPGKLWTAHGSSLGKLWVGALGRTIDDIISDINRFIREHPGELIILDMFNGGANLALGCVPWSNQDWQYLFSTLQKGIPQLNAHYVFKSEVEAAGDITNLPLSFWFDQESSPVLVRVPTGRTEFPITTPTPGIPGVRYGFFGIPQIPYSSAFTNTLHPQTLIDDQIRHLKADRTSPSDQIDKMSWTFTSDPEIIAGSDFGKQAMYTNTWPACTQKSYPSWIETDNIIDGQVAAMAIALNWYYAELSLTACS